MARDFTKTSGEYLGAGFNTYQNLLVGASQVTCAVRFKPSSFAGSQGSADNRVFQLNINGTSAWFIMNVNQGNMRVGGRSQPLDTFRSATGNINISQGVWYTVVGTMDFAAGTLSLWVNGNGDRIDVPAGWDFNTLQAGGTSTEEDALSGDTTTNSRKLDGTIQEWAIWAGRLTTPQTVSIDGGASMLRVNAGQLVDHVELRSGVGNVTSTIQQNLWTAYGVQEYREGRPIYRTGVITVPSSVFVPPEPTGNPIVMII